MTTDDATTHDRRDTGGGPADGAVLAHAWELQHRWSAAAGRAKAGISRDRLIALLCGVAFAVFGTGAALTMEDSPGPGKALAFAAALAAGGATLAGQRNGVARIRDWTRMRSTSEALKGEVYVCLAGAGGTGAAERRLAERVEDLLADGGDLDRHVAAADPGPEVRALPAVRDLSSYMEVRVRGQVDGYYRPRAQGLRRTLTRVRGLELALGVLAMALGAWSGTFEVAGAGAWLAVAATVGMAVTAHASAANYAYQELEFSRTAQELHRTYARWLRDPPATPEAEERLIAHCEHVISAQNEAWTVKWQEAA